MIELNRILKFKILSFILAFSFDVFADNVEAVTIPKELYYKNKIIPPYCITERNGSVIDLDKCVSEFENNKNKEHNIIPNANYYQTYNITSTDNKTTLWFEDHYPDLQLSTHNAQQEHSIEYLGEIDGHMLMFVRLNYYAGSNTYTSEILSFERIGNELIVKKLNTDTEQYVSAPYIKNNTLYFTEDVSSQILWVAILNGTGGTKYRGWGNRILEMPVASPKEHDGTVFYRVDKLSEDLNDPKNYLPIIIPEKVEIYPISSEADLQQYKPATVSDERVCSDLPYFETVWEYSKHGKYELKTKKDFEDFVEAVNYKCNLIKNEISM